MKRLLNIGALALAILSTAALVATAAMVITADRGGDFSRYDGGIPGTPAPATVDYDARIKEIPNPARAAPKLTESQLDDVRAAVNSNASLKGLLNGGAFAITGIGAWSTGKERELIGALVVVELDAPVSYDGTLPSVGFENPPDKPELYTEGGHYSIRARGIRELTIMVDLHKREAVSIEVSKAAEAAFGDDPNIFSARNLLEIAIMAVTFDRGRMDVVPRYYGAPAPAATATRDLDAYIKEVPNPAREVPELTENQVEEVKSLLNSDPSLKSLLAGGTYAIQEMGPWVSGGREREFIGAVVQVGLDKPTAYDGFLPIAESYDKPEDGSGELYVDGGHMQRLRAEGIERLAILVDLNKDKVVTIEVEKAASLNIDYGYGSQPPIRNPLSDE